MAYKYVTENNLENKQTYMYSEYQGKEFLKSYFEERTKICNGNQPFDKQIIKSFLLELEVLGDTQEQLKKITELVLSGKYPREEFEIFLKAFEVRKRLHDGYVKGSIKPIDVNNYYNYNNYLLLACCCVFFYKKTTCLKYLNTLLKVDDTLISICESLSARQRNLLNSIISTEIAFIEKLLLDKAVYTNREECHV